MNVGEDIETKAYQPETFSILVDDLLKEIEVRNYRITRIYDIDNIFDQTNRGVTRDIPFAHYKIVEFCNLNSCVELISMNLLAGVFMPLRYIVYQKTDSSVVYISFLKPSAFADQFNSGAMSEAAAVLEGDMVNVLAELDF